MVGRVKYVQGRGRSHSEIEYLHGLAILSVTLCAPEGLRVQKLERRMEKVERIFRKAEVTRVILPLGFPHADRLKQVQAVDTLNFYRCMADLLALDILKRRGMDLRRARVALVGPRLYPELCEAAKRLCQVVREVRIDVPGEDGERFAQLLQREFGLPVMPQTSTADVIVSFGPTAATVDLNLWGKEPHLNGVRLNAKNMDLPLEIEQPVLALLWEQGRLRRESIQVVNTP